MKILKSFIPLSVHSRSRAARVVFIFALIRIQTKWSGRQSVTPRISPLTLSASSQCSDQPLGYYNHYWPFLPATPTSHSRPPRASAYCQKNGELNMHIHFGPKISLWLCPPGSPFLPPTKTNRACSVCVCVLAVCICSANWLLSNFVYVCVYECCDDDVRAWKGDIKHDSVAIFRLWKEAISVIDII